MSIAGANGAAGDEQVAETVAAAIGSDAMPEEVTKRNVRTIAHLEAAARGKRSATDRLIDAITAFCGTTAFVWVHVAWFGGWVAWNTLPGLHHFDAFPFQFLTLVVSLEAILLSTFILITQNRQAIIADRRNHLDLQINMLAEQESTTTLNLLRAIADRLGVTCTDPQLEALARAASADTLVEQIETLIEREEEEHVAEAESGPVDEVAVELWELETIAEASPGAPAHK